MDDLLVLTLVSAQLHCARARNRLTGVSRRMVEGMSVSALQARDNFARAHGAFRAWRFLSRVRVVRRRYNSWTRRRRNDETPILPV